MKVRSSMLKRLGAIAFAAVLTAGILVPSVQQASAATTTKKYAVEKVSYSKNYQLDDGTTYFSVKGKFPTIKDDSEEAEKMNTALMKEKNRIIKSWKKQAAEVKQDYIDEVNAGYSSDVAFGDEIQCKITANNEKYFSVILSGYTYLGGAHGTPYRSCLTFDAKTGEKLTAAKLFGISKKQLNNKVHKLYLAKFNKNNPNDGFYPVTRKEFKEDIKNMNFNTDFYVKDNGKAVFYADPYALGPYAAGFIQVSATIK